MKKEYLSDGTHWAVIIFLVLLIHGTSYGQADSTNVQIKSGSRDKNYISSRRNAVPLSFIAGGLAIEALGIKENIQNVFPDTHTQAENYIQYAPIGVLYGADILKVPHENTVFTQTKYLVISEAVTALLTHTLKTIIHETRPDGGEHSFPSGHTSQSFSSASLVFNEFEKFNKPVAYSGYLFSTATAVLRVTNNHHWVPDVLVGAGMAIIVTNLIYYFHPLKNWDPFHFDNKVALIPDLDPITGNYSLNFIYIP